MTTIRALKDYTDGRAMASSDFMRRVSNEEARRGERRVAYLAKRHGMFTPDKPGHLAAADRVLQARRVAEDAKLNRTVRRRRTLMRRAKMNSRRKQLADILTTAAGYGVTRAYLEGKHLLNKVGHTGRYALSRVRQFWRRLRSGRLAKVLGFIRKNRPTARLPDAPPTPDAGVTSNL